MAVYIRKFSEIGMADVPGVGGKNASLGEMYNTLSASGIRVPNGYATTAAAFWYFIDSNGLRVKLEQLMASLHHPDYSNLGEVAAAARKLIHNAKMPADLAAAIAAAYEQLCGEGITDVAVRSSATAEDLPQASFAGQHESYLNISGAENVIAAVQDCFASLYTDRAIKYREDNGFEHGKVALSAGVQRMVRSDKACAGVGFTLDPESGFRHVVHLAGSWGLGENVVQGSVTPDEYQVFKPTLLMGRKAILQKKVGDKAKTMIYAPAGAAERTINTDTPPELQEQLVLSDDEINTLARWAVAIEAHYEKPMDIEWAKDGITGELFIVQARPETVHSRENRLVVKEYHLTDKGKLLATGDAVGSKIAAGVARVLRSPEEAYKLNAGEIVVTALTSPDWDPILKKAGGIVTDKGGRTSHASIVARELGVPAVIGTNTGSTAIQDSQLITVDCAEGKQGYVYDGRHAYREEVLDFSKLSMPQRTAAMLIISDPDTAFKLSFYPNNGVGLLRMEFMVTHEVQVHPMALVRYDSLKDEAAKQKIARITRGYADKTQFFVDRLSRGVATIAAAFYPKDVIVRMSDFKTNEYANLVGGTDFEPVEENPMIGFRGASRYYHPLYAEGFALECRAMKYVREEMGLTNVKIMIPFCRTLHEAEQVIAAMEQNGLKRGEHGLQLYMMVEIPSNVILAEKFAQYFDGFSIGSNDLTQLVLGADRDSAMLSEIFSPNDEAVKTMIADVLHKARKTGTRIGLCGQAPSDYPEYAQFLVENGISSISFNPDALLQGIANIVKAEGAVDTINN